MKLLLDTQLLLWAAGQPERISKSARKLLNDPKNELVFSVDHRGAPSADHTQSMSLSEEAAPEPLRMASQNLRAILGASERL